MIERNYDPEKFEAAMTRFAELDAAGRGDSLEAVAAFKAACDAAPQAFLDDMHEVAVSLGLIPEAFGYSAAGEPVYALDAVAKSLAMPPEGLQRRARELRDAGILEVPDHSEIMRRQ